MQTIREKVRAAQKRLANRTSEALAMLESAEDRIRQLETSWQMQAQEIRRLEARCGMMYGMMTTEQRDAIARYSATPTPAPEE